ncbi:MAG: hypothetical protein ACYC4I_00020 [Minisyncoccota bacterium]
MNKIVIVAAPKKFEGHIKIIQDNAIRSWGLLFGAENICLFGDSETEENAKRLGVQYAKPEYSDTNVPLLDSILKTARTFNSDYILFLNSDIILMDDFKNAFELLEKLEKKPFMMVGRRTNLDFRTPLDFTADWQEDLRSLANKNGDLAGVELIDYFLFPSTRFQTIPPLRIGRPGVDNVLLYWARKKEKLDLIDATADVQAIHQNHDYSYFPGGKPAIYVGKDRDINFELGGGNYRYYFFISESNLFLESGILKGKPHIPYYLSRRYLLDVLPVMHPLLYKCSLPLWSVLRGIKHALQWMSGAKD